MFKFIKYIFKSKENDYCDELNYPENAEVGSRWEEQSGLDDDSRGKLLSNISLIICIIALYLLLLLPKSEILKALYEHGYWYVIAIFTAVCAIIIVPVSYLLRSFVCILILELYAIKRQNFKDILKTCIFLLFGSAPLLFLMDNTGEFLDLAVKTINHKEMTPSYTIRTVITDRYHSSRVRTLSFKVGDRIEKIEYGSLPKGKYNVGDSMKVVYGKGTLGITDVMDWELIEHDHDAMVGHSTDYNEKPETIPCVEQSFGGYLGERLPAGKGIADGWTEASFTIDGDGNVHKVKTSSMRTKVGKALHKALIDMGKWIGTHEKGKTEKVNISLVYLDNKPNYLIVERKVTSDDGSTSEIRDEYDMNYKKRNVVVWTAHEEK